MPPHVLSHARIPSVHVCSNPTSPGFPQLLNQLPPRAQHVGLPDFLVAHLVHRIGAAVVIVVTAAVCTYVNIGKLTYNRGQIYA